MKALADFYNWLLPELPGCSTAFLDLHMVEAAREYCQRTSAWRADLDPVSLEADEDTYDLDGSQTQSVVAMVIRLTIDDDVLYDREWHPESHRDEPEYAQDAPFTVNAEGTEITLIEDEIPDADSEDGMEIHAALKPRFGATHLPDLLLTEQLEGFRKFTLARLMTMAGKPWSNPELARQYASEADQKIQLAATLARRGNSRAPLRTRNSIL